MGEKPKTMSVPAAGRLYFDIGRNASYEAARKGIIPTIEVGGKKRAIVAALERMVAADGPKAVV